MTYELAKQLKDAEFPKQGFQISEPNAKYPARMGQSGTPTLSELIQAVCAKPRHTFSLSYDEEWAVYEPPNEDGPWSARYYDLTPVGFYERGAKSPEEAVAKLWLALTSVSAHSR